MGREDFNLFATEGKKAFEASDEIRPVTPRKRWRAAGDRNVSAALVTCLLRQPHRDEIEFGKAILNPDFREALANGLRQDARRRRPPSSRLTLSETW